MEVLDKPILAKAKRKPVNFWANGIIAGLVAGIPLIGVPLLPDLVDQENVYLHARFFHLQFWLGPLTYFCTLLVAMFSFAAWGKPSNNHLKYIFLTGSLSFNLSIVILLLLSGLTSRLDGAFTFSITAMLMFHMGIGIVSLLLWYVPGNMAYFRNQVTVPDEAP